jgi:hypothetical protein
MASSCGPATPRGVTWNPAADDARWGAVSHGGPVDDHRRRAAGTCRHMIMGAAGPPYRRLPRPRHHPTAAPPFWPAPIFGTKPLSQIRARSDAPNRWGGQRVWKFYRVTGAARLRRWPKPPWVLFMTARPEGNARIRSCISRNWCRILF